MSVTPSQRWIEQQRSKPSFVVAGKDSQDVVLENTLMHMPASLQAVALPPPAAYANSPANALTIPAAQRSSPRRALTPSGASTTPNRTRSSDVPIHEQLLQRGKLYEQHLEALREKAVRQEIRRCRSVPRISSMGHNIQRDSAIETRLSNVFEEKKQLEFFNVQILQKKEAAVMEKWFHPSISAKGRRAAGKAHKDNQKLLHERWEFKRQKRIEEARKEKIVKELQEVRGTPDIEPKSALLAARRREKEGMAGYTHLEAMLERDRLAKLARWEEQQRNTMSSVQASPRITEFAASLHRHGDIGERLMLEAQAREERRLQRERERMEEEQMRMVGQQGTPSRFRPDDLATRQQEYIQRRDAKIRSVHEAEKRMHTPTINPTSDTIASRLSQSTMERLTTPPRAVTPSRMRRDNSFNTSMDGSDIQPPRAATPRVQADDRLFERLQLQEAKRKLRLEAARTEQAVHELDGCTFAPQTTTHYYPPMGSSAASGGESSSVYDRMLRWQQRREEKLAEQRSQHEREELERTAASTPSHGVSPPVASRAEVVGFNDFVQRQQAAIRSRTPPPANSDSASRRQPTTPSAPALGKDRDPVKAPVVLSLQRPVTPPATPAFDPAALSLRYSLNGSNMASNATPIAHDFLRSAQRSVDDSNSRWHERMTPADHQGVSLDADERLQSYLV